MDLEQALTYVVAVAVPMWLIFEHVLRCRRSG